MARNTKARGKVVRRLGVNIFGNRKYSTLLKRKPQGPGLEKGHRSRKKVSDYGLQLMEKQKIRYAYGVSEKQFFNTFLKAKRNKKGLTGDNFLILLECRLDNVIYRLGWANSRSQARQIVSHGHVLVNGRKNNIPSMTVKANDVITIKNKDSSKKMVRESMSSGGADIPTWITLNADNLEGKIERLPLRDDITTIANEQLIVEYYSR